jgi:tRNA(His) guanylyltransferase
MKKDDLGDRMKLYEQMEAGRRFMPGLPILARIDGKNFSKLTRNMNKPYDLKMMEIMCITTSKLVEETCALLGYTQSDEITLLFRGDHTTFFEGKIHKMVSVISSMATAIFNNEFLMRFRRMESSCFDCRVWTVPNQVEAVNAVLWREIDATKNSISAAARCYYSHKQLQNKTGKEMQEMLFDKGINWNDYHDHFKRGTYYTRQKRLVELSGAELAKIPEAHRPTGPVERTVVDMLKLPRLASVKNRVEVIFEGADLIVDSPDANQNEEI